MSASDPTKKNEKVQGVSKSILVVDYLPTQATLDNLDYAFPFQEPLYRSSSKYHVGHSDKQKGKRNAMIKECP